MERHSVGWFAAQRSLTGPAVALFARRGEGIAQDPLNRQLLFLQPVIGYRYHSEAIVSADTPTLAQEDIDLLDPLELKGLPGTRIPHLWLERQGQRISTLDLLDGRFVLFAGPHGAAWCEAARALARRGASDLAAYGLGPGADLPDVENAWETKMGVSSEGAVLVRPDGFVAWRAHTRASDAESVLEQAFSQMLCWPPAAV